MFCRKIGQNKLEVQFVLNFENKLFPPTLIPGFISLLTMLNNLLLANQECQ